MPRVYEVARELGMSSRELMDLLRDLGHPVTGQSSEVDGSMVAVLKSNEIRASSLLAGEGTETLERPEPAAETPARPSEAAGPPAEREKEPAGVRRRRRLRSAARHLAELPVLVALAFVIAVLVKTFLVQAFFIPSGSMQPTLQISDRVLVEKVGYRISDPRRGQVVVFEREGFGVPEDLGVADQVRNFLRELLGLPTGARDDYIKRVVAVAGDAIRYVGSPRALFVNGEPVDESYLGHVDRDSPRLSRRDCERLEMQRTEEGCRVPAGTVFVMGDNRGNSEDSRSFGAIDQAEVVGRAVVLIWPPGHFGTL